MKKIYFVFVLCISILQPAKAYDILRLTNNEGLSNSSINTINQNSDGLMWFGSWDGLNIYNGREFKVFKPEPGNPQSISNNIIRDILEENKNIQWIATDFGINRFNLQKKTFDRYFVNTQNQSVYNEHSFLIAKNSKNQIFAAVYGKGVYYFNKVENKFVQLNVARNLGIRKIFIDLDDNLWLFTDNKLLLKIVIKKGDTETIEIENLVKFNHLGNLENVFCDKHNQLWIQTADEKFFSYQISVGQLREFHLNKLRIGLIRTVLFKDNIQFWGTEFGLFQFDPRLQKTETVLSNVSVLSLYAGTQQIIWVGTDMQGIWQLSPVREKFLTYSTDNIPTFGQSAVRTFFEDSNRNLWVGTKGKGIYIFNQSVDNKRFTAENHFTTSNGLLSNSVFTIIGGPGNEYWIGTDGKGINYYDTKAKKIRTLFVDKSIAGSVNLSSVYAILPTDKDLIWVGTSGYGMYKLKINRATTPYSILEYKQFVFRNNVPTSLSNNIVYSIIRDDEKHLWIGTRGGGLNRFNIQTEEFKSYKYSSQIEDCINSDDILCLYKDKKGKLWAGTSMGLNKLTRFENELPIFEHFTENEGLPNNTIHGILEDKENNLWLSTNKGIANIIQQKNNYRIVNYFSKDGLQNNEFSDGAFYVSPSSQKFYFGGIQGFNAFNPLEISHSAYMPRLVLDAFYVDNIPTDINEILDTKNDKSRLVLSYKNKSISFRFVPLDFITGSKCEISYLLEGYQKDWIQLGTSNTIVFTNLPKGNYLLKVRCSNAENIWSNQYYTLAIRMLPPWWESNLAFLSYFLLLILIIYGIIRFTRYQLIISNNIKLKELEKQKTEEIHQAKLRFFTNIAHEFSNSLTLIYGPCEQLLRTHSTDKVTRKYIHTIKSNSERMQSLIQQLIEFRKAETGHLRLDIELVDVNELVKFVIDNFQELIEQNKIDFKLTFSPDVIHWQTDRDSIEKIIFNLVSNALKYTPVDEKIEIQIEIIAEKLVMKIKNTGVGIKEEFRQSIFDRFEVLERFEKQVSKGLETRNGIGLALCKNIVEVLNGSIEVESDGENYTTFIVQLPQSEINTSAEKKTHHISTNHLPFLLQNNQKLNSENEQFIIPDNTKEGLVLIIDDEKEIRQLLSDFLTTKFEVAEAANGQEAIEIMKLRMPTIIISDIIMPVMNGVDFVKIMKSQELTRHIPIILLSSKSSVESQIEGLETGADAYLSKPFHPRHLDALIESLLHHNKAVLDYSESPYSAVEQLEGKLIRKEDKALVVKITSIIYDQIDNDNLSLDFIASEMAISKMQLYRKIKESVGSTPTEYIRSIRLKHAEKLLKTTNKTVQEIMYLCGFNNKAYFYREFSKKYHHTPGEYRSNISNQG